MEIDTISFKKWGIDGWEYIHSEKIPQGLDVLSCFCEFSSTLILKKK